MVGSISTASTGDSRRCRMLGLLHSWPSIGDFDVDDVANFRNLPDHALSALDDERPEFKLVRSNDLAETEVDVSARASMALGVELLLAIAGRWGILCGD